MDLSRKPMAYDIANNRLIAEQAVAEQKQLSSGNLALRWLFLRDDTLLWGQE
jgi:hypothetical protein